jgi:hypothetical protein
VHRTRNLLMSNRTLAALVLACALVMKLIVPSGFMPTISHGHFIVIVCTSVGPMSMTMPGIDHDKPREDGQHGKPEAPCAFAGLSAPLLAAADLVLLAAAILFVMALGLRALMSLKAPALLYLRPYLRGPPATA